MREAAGDILASYVPASIASRASTEPASLQAPAVDHFQAAVLFADISGFTPLSERLAERGPAGAETLTWLLNDYFGQLIELIAGHGGDVITFAGDALLAVWPAAEGRDVQEALAAATQMAARCGLAAQEALHDYLAEGDVRLSLRISISAGQASGVHLGGIEDRREYLLSGEPIVQVGASHEQARPGEVVLSSEARTLIREHCAGEPRAGGCLRLEALSSLPPLPRETDVKAGLAPAAALRPYIPRSVLSRVEAGHTDWLAELRPLTVLFISLPDLDHRTPLDKAHEVTCALQAELYRYEASINKLSVDNKGATMVAALGLPPLAHEDDPVRGVRAALGVLERLHELDWRGAIGITTGRAFCGAVGNARRREYTMMGDVVNLSSRLMEAALAGAGELPAPVLCDEATYHAAQARLLFQPLPAIEAKGKAGRVAVYCPLGEQQPAARSEARIVGRREEQAVLGAALEALTRGETAGVVILEGEAGIGKTRLLDDLRARARQEGAHVFSAAGDAVERRAAYHGWRWVFAELLGVEAAADDEERRQVERVLGPELCECAPLLNVLLPLDFPENETTRHMVGQARADRTRDVLVALLQASVVEAPSVIFLEDAHWLDSASWALALEINQRIERVLLVIATRPMAESLPPEYVRLLEAPRTRRLPLPPLADEEALALVCGRLGVTDLPEPVAALIREEAEGHPFFSEELAYALRDAGLIEVRGGQCRVAPGVDLKAVSLPDTVQGVITSRIDRLMPQQQLTLKVASVIGALFSFEVLRDIYPVEADKPDLPEHLRALERFDLTRLHEPEPNLTYAFKHVITREAAYNLMLFAQRRELHRALAEWYERAFAEGDLSPFYPILAHHWAHAEVVPKAIGYLEKSAMQALYVGTPRESVAFGLEAARMLSVYLPADPQEITRVIPAEIEGIQRILAGRKPGDLIELSPSTDPDIEFVVGILLHVMPAAFISRQPELFALMGLTSLRLTLTYGHSVHSPGVYSMYAIILRAMTGDSRTAYEFSRLAMDLDARQGGRLAASVTFVHTWFINHWINPLETAVPISEEGARKGLETGDLLYACYHMGAIPVYMSMMGAPLEEVIRTAGRLCGSVANRVLSPAFHCMHELQTAKALAGRTVDRLSLTDAEYDEVSDIASICETENYNQTAYYFLSRMKLHYYYREYEAALGYGERMLPLLPAFQGQVGEIEYTFFYILTLLGRAGEAGEGERQGLIEAAAAHLERIRDWSRLCEANFRHKALLAEAELARVAGRTSEAFQRYAEAARSAEAFKFVQHAALAHELAGRYHLELGDESAARRCLAEARAAYVRWGAWAKVADLDEQVGRLKV
jgi:predicted ATPase/class 3 adenylate cyclase